MGNKAELKFIIVWSIFISALAFLPLIYGYFSTPAGKAYTGLTASIYYSDVNSYFSWIRQAQEGSFLFEDKFTSEPHHAWLFQPVFLAIGLLSRILYIDVIYIWYFAIIASNFSLLFVIYLFLCAVFPNGPSANGQKNEKTEHFAELRVVSFIIITIAAGFGWLLPQISADGWLVELSTFQSMRWPFILSLAISLILLAFLSILKSEQTGKIKFAAFAGFYALLLAVIHPYDLYLVIPIALLYLALQGFIKKRLKKAFLKISAFAIPILPGVLYNLYLVLFDPVFELHNKISLPSPPFLSYVLGFGLLSLFGLLGTTFTILEMSKLKYPAKDNFLFLLVWIIAGVSLLYAPINFQRKLAIGLQIPLAVFSAVALKKMAANFKSKKTGIFLTSLAISILSIGSFTSLYKDAEYFKKQDFPFFIDKKFLAALNWLDKNTENKDIILSSYNSGNFIPRFSGNRVFIGHWAQTINIAAKEEGVKKFYSKDASGKDMELFVKKNGINYVFCGDFEYECKEKGWEEKFGALGGVNLVFSNQSVKIYKVSNSY